MYLKHIEAVVVTFFCKINFLNLWHPFLFCFWKPNFDNQETFNEVLVRKLLLQAESGKSEKFEAIDGHVFLGKFLHTK